MNNSKQLAFNILSKHQGNVGTMQAFTYSIDNAGIVEITSIPILLATNLKICYQYFSPTLTYYIFCNHKSDKKKKEIIRKADFLITKFLYLIYSF